MWVFLGDGWFISFNISPFILLCYCLKKKNKENIISYNSNLMIYIKYHLNVVGLFSLGRYVDFTVLL